MTLMYPPGTHALRRLFHRRAEFEAEVALYRHPLLRRMLPELHRASDNAAGAVRSRSGHAFPAFFVLERGITQLEWRRHPRSHHEVSTMIEHLAQLLAVLHDAGYVHRDLKVCSVDAVCSVLDCPLAHPQSGPGHHRRLGLHGAGGHGNVQALRHNQ
jgi:hypothetical protein